MWKDSITHSSARSVKVCSYTLTDVCEVRNKDVVLNRQEEVVCVCVCVCRTAPVSLMVILVYVERTETFLKQCHIVYSCCNEGSGPSTAPVSFKTSSAFIDFYGN